MNYGGGRSLPVHATVEDPAADLDSGLLMRVHLALLGMSNGQILRVSSPVEGIADQLRTFEAASGHALLSIEVDPARPGWSAYYLRKGRARTDWVMPVTRTQGSAATPFASSAPTMADEVDQLMPTRLWLYTNYDCNLSCDYCCVVAGPRVDPRRLDTERIRTLVDAAVASDMERVFLTGGEPTLRPDLPELIEYVTDRLPMTILTNAMLLRGSRWDGIRPLVERARPITFQVSLDSAGPDLHDEHRGRGAHARALAGIRTLLDAGAHVRLAASLPEAHIDEIPRLDALAATLGVAPADRIFRPIALRGAASEGEPIRPQDVAPELTCDAQGWFWHPLSNDADMRLDLPADAPMADALDAVRERLHGFMASRTARLDRFVCG